MRGEKTERHGIVEYDNGVVLVRDSGEREDTNLQGPGRGVRLPRIHVRTDVFGENRPGIPGTPPTAANSFAPLPPTLSRPRTARYPMATLLKAFGAYCTARPASFRKVQPSGRKPRYFNVSISRSISMARGTSDDT